MPLQMHKRHRLTAAEAQQQEAEARRIAREKEKEYKLPKVFYATRTHSQIAQVRQCSTYLEGLQSAVLAGDSQSARCQVTKHVLPALGHCRLQ